MTKDECEIETGKAIEEMRKMIADLKEENRQLKDEVEDLRAYCDNIEKTKAEKFLKECE